MSELVSPHQLKVFRFFVTAQPGWFEPRDVAAETGIALRTARAHCAALVSAGILERVEVFPAYRYRLKADAQTKSPGEWARLKKAEEVLGLEG